MRQLAYSPKMRGDLDDDYTLFENGEILHEYDAHRYPGGQNLKRTLQPSDLKPEVKIRLLTAANEEDKNLVKTILAI